MFVIRSKAYGRSSDTARTVMSPLVGAAQQTDAFASGAPNAAPVVDSRVRGEVVNQIVVEEHTAGWARALQRMLDIT